MTKFQRVNCIHRAIGLLAYSRYQYSKLVCTHLCLKLKMMSFEHNFRNDIHEMNK